MILCMKLAVISGVVHGDDTRLMFKVIMTPAILSTNDEKMMEYMVDFVTAFARTGWVFL